MDTYLFCLHLICLSDGNQIENLRFVYFLAGILSSGVFFSKKVNGFPGIIPKDHTLVETTPTEIFLLELTEVRRQKSQKNFTHNLLRIKIAEKFVVFGRVARSMSLKRRHFNEKFRDEKRQKRSHCRQWERNAIFRSVPFPLFLVPGKIMG